MTCGEWFRGDPNVEKPSRDLTVDLTALSKEIVPSTSYTCLEKTQRAFCCRDRVSVDITSDIRTVS